MKTLYWYISIDWSLQCQYIFELDIHLHSLYLVVIFFYFSYGPDSYNSVDIHVVEHIMDGHSQCMLYLATQFDNSHFSIK